jgi:hypothetical protein
MSKKQTRKKRRSAAFIGIKKLRCYEEVVERLIAGFPCDDVARYIQEEQSEYLHATPRSLGEVLRRYVAKEIAPAAIVERHLPAYVVNATKEFSDRLLDLQRLEMAYQVALYRLEAAHAIERRTGKVNPKVDKHLRRVVEVVRQMHDIKMDLGLTGERDLSTPIYTEERVAEIRTRYGDGAARAFADPVQRAQVLGLLKRVKRLAGREDLEEVMPVEVSGPDGKQIDARIEVDHPVWDDPIDDEEPVPAPITRPRPAARPIPHVQPRQELLPMDRTGLLPLYVGSDDLDD